MNRLPTKLVPVLLYTGEIGITPPIKEIDDSLSQFYGTAVTFAYLDYPRLSDLLERGEMDHSRMLQISYNMGRVIAVFSKYRVQDADQNLSNWLVRHGLSIVKIDFDPKYTRLIEEADPRDLDFWIAANVDRDHGSAEIRKRIPRVPHSAYRCFSSATGERELLLPHNYDAERYMERHMEGFKDEFDIPPEKTYEELWKAYLAKSKEDGERLQEEFRQRYPEHFARLEA